MLIAFSVGNVWGADATMSGGTSVTVGGKSAMKVGANKSGGSMTITVGANATSLSFYIAAWSGDNTSVSVTPTANVGTTALSPTQDSGISGSGNSFTLSGTESTYYTTITLSNITAETEITLASSAGKNRFVVWGATYETGGGSTPTVSLDPDGGNFTESVEVTITPSTGATAYYTTDATKKTTPSTTTWTAYNGSTKPTFTETTTIWVAAVKDATWSDVVEKTFTKIIPITSYDIDFETTDFDLYVNWDFTNAEVAANGANTNISAHGGTHYGTTGGKATAAIKTHSKIASPGTLSCYVSKQSDNTTSSTWYIQVSENGTDWTDVESRSATSMTKGNWVEFSADLSAYANVYVRLYYNGGTAIRNVDDISLVMASGIAKPTITGEDNFLTSTEVTISCITDGAAIYYTTTESAKATPATSGDWNAYDNSNKPSFSSTTTVWAAAKLGDDWSAVAEKTFTKATILTVAEALTIIEGLDNKTATTAEYYVSGVVSTVTALTVDGTGEYYISADGTKTSELQVYKGKWVDGANFTSTDQLIEGDDVTIKGKLKKYNDYKELDQNNEVVLYKLKARLAWSEESYEADLSSSNTFPSLTNTNGVSVSYSSSNTDAATINPSTGEISLVAVGQTTITAAFAGNGDYKANSASYTLNVASSVIRADISFEENGGSDVADLTEQSNLPDPLPTITKAGYNFGGWYTDSEFKTPAVAGAAVVSSEAITLYAKWLDPYTVAEALEIIGNLEDGGQTANSVYVAGIVCTAPTSNPSSGKLTFYISANGEESDRLQAYNCKGLNNANFEAKTDIQVMDELVIYGPLKKYIKNAEVVPEFNTGYLYSFNRPVAQTYSITYEENGANETIDDVAAATNLPNPLPTVTKSGKVFGGWWTTSTFEDGSQAVAGAPLSKNETLYAKWNDLSPWAYIYSSNIALAVDENDTKAYAEKVKITVEEVLTEFPALRAATGSAAGTCHVIVPAGTQTLHFHAAAWNAKTSKVTVKMGETTLLSPDLTSDAGIANASPYTLSGNAYEYYYSIDLSSYSLTEDTRITFSAGSDKRFVLFGVNQEGGSVPVLDHIEITGTMTNTTGWKTGDNIIPEGLTVTAYYTQNDAPHHNTEVTDDVTWSHAALVENQTEVTLTASYTDGVEKTANTNVTIDAVETGDPTIITDPTTQATFTATERGAALPAAKTIAVTLKNITSATATLGGTNPDVFSLSKTTGIVDGDEISVSVVSTDIEVASYSATVTIKDASGDTQKSINIYLTIKQPEAVETPVSTSTKWVPATAITNGMQVLITGAIDDDIYAMGAQGGNNRTAVKGSVDGDVFTPSDGTMAFTLIAQEGGTYAIQTSAGKYLYAGASNNNRLYTRDAIGDDNNANWTVAIGALEANGSNRGVMQFNSGLFNCYASASQSPIKLYVQAYTVTFNSNEGSAVAPVNVAHGQTVAQPANPTKDNYTFVKWQLNGEDYNFATPVTADITLDAVWTPVMYTVTFNSNGGSDVASANVAYGETVAEPTAPTKDNYNFVEWQLGGVAYDFTTPVTTAITLEAVWEPVTPPTPSYTEVRNGLNAGEYYTMCLDKAVTAVQGGTIWRVLSKAQNGTDIILEEVEGTLDAGRPYIFFATAATLEVAYTGDAVGAPITTGNNGLVGSFSQAHIDNVNTNYIIYNNELYYVNTDNVYVGAHRAYIDMTAVPDYSEPQQGNAPRRRVVMTVHGEQVATGIDALNASDAPAKVLINGQLFIIRGEKMFDAKGQLVK